MRIQSFYFGSYASNLYLVTDDAGEATVLIDPSLSPKRIESKIGKLPSIDTIVLTHGHFDHMLALEEWRRETGAPVAIHTADALSLQNPSLSCYRQFLGEDVCHSPAEILLGDGDRIRVGGEELTVLSTPGHTPGSIVLDTGEHIITGDTVFAEGGYGRCDLPGGDSNELLASLRRVLSLSGERRLYPGHGGETLLSEAKINFLYLM